MAAGGSPYMRCAVLLLASVLLLEREQHGGQALVVHASVLRMGQRGGWGGSAVIALMS